MKNKMSRYFNVSIIIITISALLFIGYLIFGRTTVAPLILQSSKVKMGNVTTSVTATGTVQPVDQVTVGTQVSGMVSKIYVDYNSVVKKGALLAELDKTILSESVSNAFSMYNGALNEANYYQQHYARIKNMYEAQVVSKAEFEQAAYQLKSATATVTQRQTSLSQARTNLGYANIYAPIDGIILSRVVQEGQTVAASMSAPTLFTIARDLTKMQVETNVDEADIGEIKIGQRASFMVDAYPRREFAGKVKQVRLGAITTASVVTYTVLIEADNPEEKLKPGLTATITIFTNELTNVPVITIKVLSFSPDQATLQQYYRQIGIDATVDEIKKSSDKQKMVWIKNANGTLSQKAIITGSNDGINIEVLNGLSVNDEVVTALEVNQTTTTVSTQNNQSPFMNSPNNH